MTRTLPPLLALSLVTMTLLSAFASAADGAGGDGDPREGGCAGPVDVLFVFDTTGSMGGVLSDATNGASNVMAAVQAQIPNAAFGAADYKDYDGLFTYPGYATWYGGTGDYPWKLRQPIDTNPALTAAAIGTLSAGGGADGPESLTRAVYESYSDAGIAWRPGALKIVVLFTDAPAHDEDFAGNDFGSEPGVDNVAMTSDDLEFESTVAAAASAGIVFAGVGVGGNWGAPYLQHMADETEGEYAELGSDFESEITALILELAGVRLEAHSDAILLEIVGPATEHLDLTHVEAGPHDDAHTETTNTLILPTPLDGYLKTGVGSASASSSATLRKVAAKHTIEEVSLLGGLVRATLLEADARVEANAWGAYPSTGSSHVAQLWIDGIPVTLTGPQVIVLPEGLGYIAIDERIVNQPSFDTAEVEVNGIHVHVEAPGLVADIKIAHAYAGIMCNGTHEDGPDDPVDPVVPVDPTGPVDPTTPLEPVLPDCIRLGPTLSLAGILRCVPRVPECVDGTICIAGLPRS